MSGPGPDAATGTVARSTDQREIADKATTRAEKGLTEAPPVASSSTPGTSTTAKPGAWTPAFTPGVAHGHQPCGRWAEIQERPVTVELKVDQICRHSEPAGVAKKAMSYLSGNPLATTHLKHYLTAQGKDFIEDEHLLKMLRSDAGVRAKLAARVKGPATPPNGWLSLEQRDYAVEDYQFAFGAIDRLDYQIDAANGVVRIWFQDRYEWHPVYEGLYDRQPGDLIRDNNCFHAAMVEMKLQGAADFWMKGKAIFPLDQLPAADAKQPAQRISWW